MKAIHSCHEMQSAAAHEMQTKQAESFFITIVVTVVAFRTNQSQQEEDGNRWDHVHSISLVLALLWYGAAHVCE